MKKELKYKKYVGSVEHHPDDEIYHGKITNISDLVIYEGHDLKSLEVDFKNAVEDYIEACEKRGHKAGLHLT